jgi:hypothetical protein
MRKDAEVIIVLFFLPCTNTGYCIKEYTRRIALIEFMNEVAVDPIQAIYKYRLRLDL